jgi:hypothetical protein
MPTDNIVSLLIAERDRLQAAIDLLQGPRRRGRPRKSTPPEWVTNGAIAPAPARKKRIFTRQQRLAQAKRMKAFWKAKKAAAK